MVKRRRNGKKAEWRRWHGSRWSPYGAADMSWCAPNGLRPVLFAEVPADGRVMVRSRENRAAIYALIDPVSTEIRYVGKTTQRSDIRLRQHIQCPTNANMRRWLERLQAIGVAPRIRLITCCPVAEWQRHESRWILWAREKGARLLNVDPGGECRRPGGRLNVYGRTKKFIGKRDGVVFNPNAAKDVWRRGGGRVKTLTRKEIAAIRPTLSSPRPSDRLASSFSDPDSPSTGVSQSSEPCLVVALTVAGKKRPT